MGKVPSATTLSSIAYLTEAGRRYLFGKDDDGNQIRFNSDGSDNFTIIKFALFDTDRNYKTPDNFETGEMPDIAGTSDNTCLKTSATVLRNNAIALNGEIIASSPDTITYVSDPSITQVDLRLL